MLSDARIYEELKSCSNNDLTFEAYRSRLGRLSSAFGVPLYEVLKHPKKYGARLTEAYPDSARSRRNAIAAVLKAYSCLRTLCEKKPKARTAWKILYSGLSSSVEKKAPSVDSEMLLQEYNKWRDRGNDTLQNSMKILLLSVALHLAPSKRCDYSRVAVVFAPASKSPSNDYIYMKGRCDSFSNISGIRRKLEKYLYDDVVASIHAFPRQYLFVGSDQRPYDKRNSYNAFVLRTFEGILGKRVGASELSKLRINF